jgi:predicted nucleic acid-binding Zn ribbon protein
MSLIDVLSEYKKEMNINNQLKEVGLINSWDEIAGKAIASRTTKIYIKNRCLYIHLSSSVVRNEMIMMREVIKARINEKAGEELISDIILK